jgi:hypothetical protein
VANDGVLEDVDQPASIRIIADDFLPGIAPRYNVIDSAPNSIRRRRGMSAG